VRGEMIKRIKNSMTLKWMVFSILLAIIPLAIAGFSIIQIYEEDLKRSVIMIEKEKANMVVERTRSFVEKIVSNLRSLSIDEHFREGSSPGHIKNLLESFLNQNDYLWKLTLLNEKGMETIKVSKYRVFKPSDLKDQSKTEMFQVASNLRTYYGDFKLAEGIVPTMVIAIPIEEYQRRPEDVLSAEFDLRYLWNLMLQIQIGEKGTTYVVDGGGYVIAHPDTKRVISRLNVRHLPMVDRVVAGEEGNLEFEDSGGEKYLVVYKPIKELGWGVIVQVPLEEAYAPLRQVANAAMKWILIVLGIAIIFSFFLTKRLIHPIKQLSGEMEKVSKGNLDIHVETTTKDEVGLLTESFNQMVQDLKQSHKALKEAEKKYRRIFEDSKDMVYITSADGKLVDVNRAGVDLFGYGSKEEMMQVHTRNIFLYPEDRKRFLNEIMKEWFVKDFEVKLKRKDGTPIDVLITANAVRDDSGNLISYEGIIKDISRRKKMEEELLHRTEELQALYDLSALINQTLDIDTVLRTALEKAMSLMGFAMGSIHLLNEIGDTLEMKFDHGQPPALTEGIKFFKVGEGVCGKAVQLKQLVILTVDQYPTPRLIPLLKNEGIQILVGIPLLVKERVIGAISLVSRSPRELRAREINLLESIGNQIGLALENARLFEETKKRLNELTILYEIMKISASSLNLDKMLREIIGSLNNFFKSVGGNTPEMREVITNMVFNAIEAMPKGGKIEIRSFQRKEKVFIQISDTGIGMTEEVRKKVFEPFFTTKPFSNTGLGLSMSYGIIKRFGGEIEVESKVGYGTNFTITLPIRLEGIEELPIISIAKQGRKARVLVIDDEESVRSVLARTLSQVKHEVTVAENGDEGIRLFKEKKFDIVLTDLGMPGMSGWEVCRMIKQISPRTPVGMITGWGMELGKGKMEEYGLDFLIPKPFEFNQILKVVAETMESKERLFLS
jgi:PAS domain S-box-containing protein